jgi:outer membrane protein TolC
MIPLLCRCLLPWLLVSTLPTPLTLEEVLRRAREANLKLPQASLETEAAEQKLREARAERWMKVAIDGDFVYAPPGGYDPVVTNAGEARLQLTAKQPILDGGAHRAAIDRARSESDAARARYRVAEKDLDVEVRSRFAEWLEADAELAVRHNGLERLRRYRTSLESRKASGQGIAADLFKTEVRLAADEADAIEAEARRAEASVELDVLMGLPPDTPLALAASPAPIAAPVPDSGAVPAGPEVAEAEALEQAAEADVRAARADRRLHLSASADIGWWGADTTQWSIDRWRHDAGYSLGMQVSWLLWDFGASDARIARAKLEARSAHLEVASRRREAGLQRAKAAATAEALTRQIDVLTRAEPSARDALLDAESRYRGGAASALEVIDAYAASIDASVKLAQAVSRLRIAQAVERRWETP